MEFQNKSEKQVTFNQIKGVATEKNDGEKFCSITIEVGHKNTRSVNLVCKKAQYDILSPLFNVGDKVSVRFFLTSHKSKRWHTYANILEIFKNT
jgi:hypothetical protein